MPMIRSASASSDAQHVHDAVRAAQRHAIGVRPSDADRGGTEGKGLDDVGATADAGIEQHRHPVGGLDDARQAVDRRQTAVGLAAAVIRAVDPVHPAVDGPAGVVGMADALEQQRQFGQRPQPGQVVP